MREAKRTEDHPFILQVVYVTKLLNDLSFWAEVERYKDLADIVNATRSSPYHTPEDDIMVHKKAHAIINCYIDSAVHPRVQVNVHVGNKSCQLSPIPRPLSLSVLWVESWNHASRGYHIAHIMTKKTLVPFGNV